MPSVTNRSFMLSVIMLNVIMLNVVGRFITFRDTWLVHSLSIIVASPLNIRLGWECLLWPNTFAYSVMSQTYYDISSKCKKLCGTGPTEEHINSLPRFTVTQKIVLFNKTVKLQLAVRRLSGSATFAQSGVK
jgi:hypothetical protein